MSPAATPPGRRGRWDAWSRPVPPDDQAPGRLDVEDVLRAALAEVRSASPVTVEVDVAGSWAGRSRGTGTSPTTPRDAHPDLGPGLTRILGEALRNVARHSGADRADVEVLRGSEDLVVRVVDRGRGLPPTLTEGFGLARSVRGVAQDLGGGVRLRDTPGGGTTVEVRLPWRARAATPGTGPAAPRSRVSAVAARTWEATVFPTGGMLSVVRAIAWPQGGVWLFLAVKYSLRCPDPLPLLLLAVALAALTAWVARRLERGAPSARWLVAVSVALIGAEALGLALLPAGSMLDYRSWTIGFVAVPVMVLCVFLPLWLGLLVAVPHAVVVVLAASLEPRLSMGQFPVGSLNASVSTAVLGMAIGLLLRRTTSQVRVEEARLAAAEDALRTRRARTATTSLHLDHTREHVVPWLERVASGEVAVGDPATRAHAARLVLEVRDDLYAPGFLDPAVRDAVSEARERGVRVEIGSGLPTGGEAGRPGELLRVLAQQVAEGSKVTVTPGGRDAVRLVTVPPLDDEALAPLRTGSAVDEVDHDEDRTVLLVRPPAGGRTAGDTGGPGEPEAGPTGRLTGSGGTT